ncbi:MAG: XTP/dITP diphosphatase [Peptococcia bacterium]|jgi:XTP/dITP diphosphohydrolase
MISKLLMATHNQGKAAELRNLLADLPVQILTLADFPDEFVIEETGTTFLENALQKAKAAAEFFGLPTLADDSGLEVDALQGQPGVYSARFAGEPCDDQRNNLKLLQLMQGIPTAQRTASFVSVIAFVTPQGQVFTTEGRCEGIILESLRGTGGFGYDPLFYLPELGKTMAELTLAEKNTVSHRAKALKAMVSELQKLCMQTK